MKDEDYGTFTKRRSVRSLKETMPCNKQLTNLTCLGPYTYRGIMAVGRFCTYLAALGRSVLPRPWANIPQYGPRARLVKG